VLEGFDNGDWVRAAPKSEAPGGLSRGEELIGYPDIRKGWFGGQISLVPNLGPFDKFEVS